MPIWARWMAGIIGLLVLLVVLFLAFFDWNMLRGPIGRQASAMTGRQIRLEGDLKVHLLSWTPSVSIGGLKIGNPSWMNGGDVADVQTLKVTAKLGALLTGRLDLPLLDLEQPRVALYHDAGDRANWSGAPSTSRKPFTLPPIQHFIINGGQISYHDEKKKLSLTGTIQSQENVSGGKGSFQLAGKGSINDQPFLLNVSGGPLINVRHDQPYPFNADVRAGATRVVANGFLPRPFDLGHLTTQLTVSGPDFADLFYLTGLALPNTGPYRLSGQLVRNEKRYQFTGVDGRVGDSDLEGVFVADDTSGRPVLNADLRSRNLDFKDLAPLIGAPTKGERHTALQQTQAATLATEKRILPEATLNVTRVRAMDATLKYRAETVKATPHMPLRSVALDLTLNHGVLRMDPIAFGFPQGTLAGMVQIDARNDVPVEDIDLRLTNIRVENFVAAGSANPPVEGTLEARAKLHGHGDSVHKAAASADGNITIVAPRGKMRRAFAELLGIDLGKGLGLFLAKNESDTPIRCAVADFRADHGLLTAQTLVFDTDPVIAQGQGTINLEDESLDLSLQGHPKKFQLVRLKAGIAMTGHLASPKFGLKPGAAPAQVAAGVALGVLLTPIGAVLPFVDPGLAKDADCAALVSEARAAGAPVKVSQTTTAPSKAKH